MLCSICEKDKPLPYETPDDPPFFAAGRHCEECEQWLLGLGEEPKMHNPYKQGTNRYFIGNQFVNGKNEQAAYDTLAPKVKRGNLVFKRNPTDEERANGITERVPLPEDEALTTLKAEIGRVYAAMRAQ